MFRLSFVFFAMAISSLSFADNSFYEKADEVFSQASMVPAEGLSSAANWPLNCAHSSAQDTIYPSALERLSLEADPVIGPMVHLAFANPFNGQNIVRSVLTNLESGELFGTENSVVMRRLVSGNIIFKATLPGVDQNIICWYRY